MYLYIGSHDLLRVNVVACGLTSPRSPVGSLFFFFLRVDKDVALTSFGRVFAHTAARGAERGESCQVWAET